MDASVFATTGKDPVQQQVIGTMLEEWLTIRHTRAWTRMPTFENVLRQQLEVIGRQDMPERLCQLAKELQIVIRKRDGTQL